MADSATLAGRVELGRERAGAVPWYVWSLVAAITSAVIGAVWDISWHKSIGRDTFWTPAHILIYICGVLGGGTAAWLIGNGSFGGGDLRGASVRVWGLRGPLGAFLCAWGGVAMLASAPFDDWWHNAYGLDVKVLSPPHVVLILGILAIRLGTLLVILGEMNRAAGLLRRKLDWLFLYTGTVVLGAALGAFLEITTRNYMHGGRFYILVSLIAPLVMVGVAEASGRRWAATTIGGLFTALALVFLWVLPLFPAEPKLGPVYHQVTHFIPNDFPLLILAPAVALDLLRRRCAGWQPWRFAAVAGPVFLAVFAAAQWPFADFLISPASRNWIFGTHYIPFFVPPEADYVRGIFTQTDATAGEFWLKMVMAAQAAMLSVRGGLGWGDWMKRIRR